MGDKIKLTYFNVDGRAFAARMMFTMADVDFEDERLTIEDPVKWQEKRKEFPLGQLPILSMNGEVYPQSTAINNYVARKYDMNGGSERNALVCDILNESCNEISTETGTKLSIFLVYKFAPHPGDEIITKSKEEVSAKMDKILKMARGFQQKDHSNKFLLGEKITAADVYLYCCLDYVRKSIPDLKVDDWVPQWESRFRADKGVKKYLDIKPEIRF